MQGNPKFQNLVESSFCDTKPVHYLSMVSSNLKWVVTEKCALNVDMGITETLSSYKLIKFIFTTSLWLVCTLYIN